MFYVCQLHAENVRPLAQRKGVVCAAVCGEAKSDLC